MTLRRRLLLFCFGLVGGFSALSVLMGAMLWWVLMPTLNDRLRHQTNELTDRLARSLEISVAASDKKLLAAHLKEIEHDPDLEGVLVLDAQRAPLHATRPKLTGALMKALDRPPRQSVDRPGRLVAWAPIEVEGLGLGWVVVSFSKQRLEVLKRLFAAFALVCGLALLVSGLFVLRFTNRFVGPLHSVMSFTRRVAEGHLDERMTSAHVWGELRQLVDHLNGMAEALEERSRAIEQQQRDLEQAREDAQAASRAKSQFLANMSHEIRTPLNGVIGMAEVVLGTELSEGLREDVTTIRDSARSLLSIIEDILDISKIEAEKLEVESIEVDLAQVVSEAVTPVAVQGNAKGLRMYLDVAPEVPRWIVSDSVRLRQIVVNLLSNALKFTEAGYIKLYVEARDGRLHLSVEDQGVGMSAAQLEKVFDAFTQADSSTTRRFGGTGLGLTISKRIAELMGGSLWAQSELGKGSIFHLELPLVAARPAVAERLLAGQQVYVYDFCARRASHAMRLLEALGAQALPWFESAPDEAMFWVAYEAADARANAILEGLSSRGALPKTIVALSPGLMRKDRPAYLDRARALISHPVFQETLAQSLKKPAAQVSSMANEAPKRALKVLIADDNRVNRLVASKMVKRMGHEAILAEDGAQAIAAVEAGAFDVVLMDVQMPVMDGIEATRSIRAGAEAWRETPIVALTAHAMVGDSQRCLVAGMDAYLSKPIKPKALSAVLARVVEGTLRSVPPCSETSAA